MKIAHLATPRAGMSYPSYDLNPVNNGVGASDLHVIRTTWVLHVFINVSFIVTKNFIIFLDLHTIIQHIFLYLGFLA